MTARLSLVVLVSGRGSNLRALQSAIEQGSCAAEIRCVLSDRASAPALEYAAERGIATKVVSPQAFTDRAAWDAALAESTSECTPGLVVLAGFMRLLGPSMLAHFPGRIVNVHPALLPAFPGKDGPAQAVAAKVALSGCTVHVVDAGVDTGPILAQAAVPVLRGDDAASLHARIQVAEHQLLPRVVHAVARGHYELGPVPRYVGPERDEPGLPLYAWPSLEG
ncbi:MAG: phosphoribosylglycinamide formyltransferase [Myxococcales bacterium]